MYVEHCLNFTYVKHKIFIFETNVWIMFVKIWLTYKNNMLYVWPSNYMFNMCCNFSCVYNTFSWSAQTHSPWWTYVLWCLDNSWSIYNVWCTCICTFTVFAGMWLNFTTKFKGFIRLHVLHNFCNLIFINFYVRRKGR